MKRLFYIFILAISSFSVFSQTKKTDEDLQQICDSILIEANLLYRYEKAAWISTDLIQMHLDISSEVRGYLVYQNADSIINIFYNDKKECIYEYAFTQNENTPILSDFRKRELRPKEAQLLKAKEGLIFNILTEQYPVVNYENYNLNMIFLPFEDNYKLYFISGATQADIIPFGNDYLFIGDKEGKILSWKKFHSVLIPIGVKNEENQTSLSSIHSHLEMEPYISATDICTFKLYAKMYQHNDFFVYSPSIGKYFKYDLQKDSIEITDKTDTKTE